MYVLNKVVTNIVGGVGSFKPKFQEPKPFVSTRSSNNLKNFLWDMKYYFSVAKIYVDGQVDITMMYLMGDTKLWWQIKTKEDLNTIIPKVEI